MKNSNLSLWESAIKNATVLIYDDKDQSNFGTGFFVTPNRILTCRHVIANMKKIKIFNNNGTENRDNFILKKNIKIDTKLDLALISIEKPTQENMIVYFSEEYERFDKVIAWGKSTLLNEITGKDSNEDSFTGEIEAILKNDTFIKFKGGMPESGFSGSALININTKNAIGIIPYKIQSNQPSGLAISASKIFSTFPEIKLFQDLNKIDSTREEYIKYALNLGDLFVNTKVLNDDEVLLKDVYLEQDFKIFKLSVKGIQYDYYFKGNLFTFYSRAYSENDLEYDMFTDYYHLTLNEFVYEWITNKLLYKKAFSTICKNVLFILGEPGQGKTSFCYKLLHDLISNSYHLIKYVFFIKLRYVQNIELLYTNPIKAIFDYLQENVLKYIKEDHFNNSIIILDGLDEIELFIKSTRSYADYADILVNSLQNKLQGDYENIKIIITSRYYIDLAEIKNKYPVLSIGELTIENQKKWLIKYKELARLYPPKITIDDIDKINNKNNKVYKPIRELINQTILLQIITIVGIDTANRLNKSQIYEKLFSDIVGKSWDNSNISPLLRKLTPNKLRKILQVLAFETYRTNKQYLLKNQIVDLLQKNDVKNLHNIKEEEDIFRGLMIAFYFRKTLNNEIDLDYRVEFMHKSLSEYLSAEHIWAEIKTNFSQQIVDLKVILDVLYRCFERFAPIEVIEFLKEVIYNDSSDKENIISNLKRHKHELYLRQFSSIESTRSGIETSTNVFYGYVTICSALSISMEEDSKLGLKLFIEILASYGQNIDLTNWGFYNLKLPGIYLANCNITNTLFKNCILNRADFSNTYLNNISFDSCQMRFMNFSDCEYFMCNFLNSEIEFFEPRGKKLSELNFDGCSIRKANFHEGHLNNIKFVNSKLIDVSLEFTTLNNVDFSGSSIDTYAFEKVYSFVEVYGLDNIFLNKLLKELKSSSHRNEVIDQVLSHIQGAIPAKINL